MSHVVQRIDRLKSIIAETGPMAVAYSGGVDSTFLLAVARQVLADRVIAITAHTPLMADADKQWAADMAATLGVRLQIVFPDVMGSAEFIANPPHRCYICKKMMLTAIGGKAADLGFERVVHGANADDLADFRPGMAAAEELGVAAPLVAAGFGKQEIRRLSHQMALATWDRPAMACLASRIAYGQSISLSTLSMIDRAESQLRSLGFGQCRVRVHGAMARIEVAPRDFHPMLSEGLREAIIERFRSIGFAYVALDMEGYAPGRMNRVLSNPSGGRADDGTIESAKPIS